MSDELERLAAADPVAEPPEAPPAPAMRGAPGRPRRLARIVGGATGAAALGGLIAALIVATPSGGDDPAVTTPDPAPLRVSLLDRPGVAALVPLPDRVDPASVRLAARAAGVFWYAAASRDGREVCLLSLGARDEVVLHRCAPIAQGLVAGARRDGARLRVAGIVPDGIGTVTIGPQTSTVRDNAFTLITKRRPDVVVLQGPAAPRIPRRPDVAVAIRAGDPPATAVSFVPDPGPAGPAAVRGTLREASAAMPFTVLAPDPPPRGAPLAQWTDPVPGAAPQVQIRYLRTSGPGITVIERAAVRGTPDRRPVVTRDMPDGAVVRTVLDGTLVEVRGPQDALDDLQAVAASLRPVAP